ncbi:MAG: cache domain-containing protein [Acidobacteria bacterium]|nr:cache domain-containing protein [Acidobacteriota bacterium]
MSLPRNPFVLVVSFALVLVPFLGAVAPSFAQTTASDVMDRATVKTFVERAAALTESRVSNAADSYDFFDSTFRPTGEWNMGSIYLYVMNTQGIMRFHGANQSLEETSLYNHRDKNGVYYIRELIAAAEAGGGYVEYLFDNPDVVGDEEEGSPKVGYAELLDLSGERLLIGSGYYPAVSTPIAPPLALLALATLLAGGAYRRWRQR